MLYACLVISRKSLAIVGGIAAAVIISSSVSYYYYGLIRPDDGTTSENNSGNSADIPRVLPVNSTVDGFTYAEWTAKWWQWLVSVPLERNPAADITGEFCAENQDGPVWFKPGTFGGTVDRKCEIPTGKYILIAMVNTNCSPAEYTDIRTESEMRGCARAGNDSVTELFARIDGVDIGEPELRTYRVDSPVFNMTLMENNILGLDPQTTSAVSDGYWLFLEPLSEGSHNIQYRASIIDVTDPSQNFVTEARYQITVR